MNISKLHRLMKCEYIRWTCIDDQMSQAQKYNGFSFENNVTIEMVNNEKHFYARIRVQSQSDFLIFVSNHTFTHEFNV